MEIPEDVKFLATILLIRNTFSKESEDAFYRWLYGKQVPGRGLHCEIADQVPLFHPLISLRVTVTPVHIAHSWKHILSSNKGLLKLFV